MGMFKEIENIKNTLEQVDENFSDTIFPELWETANTLTKERLTNTDYQFLDIKRKMNVIHILCVLTHLNNKYSMALHINKFLEKIAKLDFNGAANSIKSNINMGKNMQLSNYIINLIKNI